jgi:NTE family protein
VGAVNRVVAVFGGGGAKAIAHVGAWKAIHEVGARHALPVQITHIVGTSMGAVIGAALAAGSTPDEVVTAARSLSRKDVAPLDPVSLLKGVFASHILRAEGLRRLVSRFVTVQSFAELEVPLTVTATDLDSGELVLFGGPHPLSPSPKGGEGVFMAGVTLPDALYASSALPLYYPPLRLDGRRLADGGLRAVLPLGPAQRIPADLVVAVHVGPGFDETLPPPTTPSRLLPPPLIRAHGEVERIMMAAQAERAIAEWPSDAARLVVVRPVAEREATFAVEELARYLEAGYAATRRAIG